MRRPLFWRTDIRKRETHLYVNAAQQEPHGPKRRRLAARRLVPHLNLVLRLSLLLSLSLIWATPSIEAKAQSGAATGELAYVPTPAFEALAPVGWTATWYDELNTLLATPNMNDSTAPSLLVGLAGPRQSLDAAEMGAYLSRLVIEGGQFALSSREATAEGELLLYANGRGDREAAVLLTPLPGGGNSALTIFVAGARDFDALFGPVLTRRIGASVREQRTQTRARTSPPPSDLTPPQNAAPAPSGAASAAVSTPRPTTRPQTRPISTSAPEASAAPQSAVAQSGVGADLAPFLDRPLAPVDLAVQADRNAAPLLRGLVMTLRRDGVASLLYDARDSQVRGAWRRNGEAIEIEWPAGEGEDAPSRWRFRVRPDGLGVLSVRMRPVRPIATNDLAGRLVLDGGDPLKLRPAPNAAALSVSRIDFATDGRFSIRGQSGRSAGGTFEKQGDAVILRFWEGGESAIVARVMPALAEAPQLIDFSGHRYARVTP